MVHVRVHVRLRVHLHTYVHVHAHTGERVASELNTTVGVPLTMT